MREPVLAAGGFSSLLSALGAIAVHYGWMAMDEVALWITLVTIAGTMGAAYWARAHSVPAATLNDAGTTVEEVKEIAANPKMVLVPQGTGDGQ